MSVLQGVLLEEIERLERNISSYEDILSKLPRGTIFIRKMGKSSFVYRKKKVGKQVVSEYLGSEESDLAKHEIELSEEYKRIKKNIRVAKLELKKLMKASKAYA